MSDYKNALAKFLQSEKNAFAEPQRMLWPFRKDPYTGNMGLGHSMFTESIQNGFNFPAKVMRGEVPMFSEYEDGKVHYSPEMIQGANDTAGLAMTGAIGLPKPANSVGSGGGGKMMEPQATNVAERQALPMDQASRLARAREMGFDTDTTFYRGTKNPGAEQFEAKAPTVLGDPVDLPAVYGSTLPDDANGYASYLTNEGSGVIPFYTRAKIAPFDVASKFTDETRIEELMRLGYGGHYQTGGGTYAAIYDPSNIRSVNAAFDPAKTRSANLLAANPREGAAAAMTTNTGQREENALMNVLRQYGLHY